MSDISDQGPLVTDRNISINTEVYIYIYIHTYICESYMHIYKYIVNH